jgi:cyclophilin family peptidyl-prolyl cis-trans isomerase
MWARILSLLALGLALTACKRDAGSASKSFPDPEKANEKAPAEFKARFSTSKGDFVVDVHRDWAPNGADRFYNLVKIGFFDEARFFRVVPGFVVQWGIHKDGDDVMSRWRDANIPDDPPKQSNKSGTITFATSGPNSRSTQVFVNYGNNVRLDSMGFAPFGEIVEGMQVLEALSSQYGQRPEQTRIQREGNAYLASEFPALDYVKKAEIVP